MNKRFYIAVEDDSKGAGLFLPMNVETEVSELANWAGITVSELKHLIRTKKSFNGMLFEVA